MVKKQYILIEKIEHGNIELHMKYLTKSTKLVLIAIKVKKSFETKIEVSNIAY